MRLFTSRAFALAMICTLFGVVSTANAQRNVTLRLNTATLADTISASTEIQVRGAVQGTAPFTLPDANVIDWGDATTLKPVNVGGDYWELTFQLPDDSAAAFKFYAQQSEDAGIGGWEDGDNHPIDAGTGDLDTGLHYFVKGDGQAYDWSPFESKTDTVGVHFRVYMNTEAALAGGVDYDRAAGDTVGVRGGDFNGVGPLDWGSTYQLSPESDSETVPGYHIFSGIAYYPTSLIDSTQAYKFFVEPGGWESGDDRTFVIPAQDTTLHWVFFSNSKAVSGADPVMSNVTFQVDLAPLEEIGIFRRSRGDTIEVRGSFNLWDCPSDAPDDCLMQRVPGTDSFELLTPITAFPQQDIEYKYFLNFNEPEFITEFGESPPSGWEEGHRTGINRLTEFEGVPDQTFPVAYFNDVHPKNVIPAGTSVDVNFSVDMSNTDTARPFVPGTDTVFVEFSDPIWAFTQGFTENKGGDTDRPDVFGLLTDDDSDGIYTGTLTVNGPTYGIITYKYGYGAAGDYLTEPGGSTTTVGRFRAEPIFPNPDGTWPATWDLTAATFQPDAGALPFIVNSVAIERTGEEVPSSVTLSQNYPNPFNPTTSFEFGLDTRQYAKVQVFDVLGRVVATLVDGVQPAGVYTVTFDASDVSSGTYFYRLEAGSKVVTKTMTLLK